MNYLIAFGVAAVGAALQEVLYWYGLKQQLHQPEYDSMLRSRRYWIIVGAMIIGSGLGTSIVYGGRIQAPDVLIVLGAAFPLTFKKLIAASGEPRLGATESSTRGYWR